MKNLDRKIKSFLGNPKLPYENVLERCFCYICAVDRMQWCQQSRSMSRKSSEEQRHSQKLLRPRQTTVIATLRLTHTHRSTWFDPAPNPSCLPWQCWPSVLLIFLQCILYKKFKRVERCV